MVKYRFSRKAVADISGIWEYTAETWSESQADQYYKLLIKACERLAADPLKGKAYEELGPGIRGYKIEKHTIFYQTTHPGPILVLRILHERMDLKSRMIS